MQRGKIESMLNDINTKFDSIKSKLESLFKEMTMVALIELLNLLLMININSHTLSVSLRYS